MPEIIFDKLYCIERHNEPCSIGFPIKKGVLTDPGLVGVFDADRALPVQSFATSRYDDGSVRFIFIRFLTDIPANRSFKLRCELNSGSEMKCTSYDPICVHAETNGYTVFTQNSLGKKEFSFKVTDDSDSIFSHINAEAMSFSKECFEGPVLRERKTDSDYDIHVGKWQVLEEGPVCAVLRTKGYHKNPDTGKKTLFEVKLSAWAGRPSVEVSYRLINTTDDPIDIFSLEYNYRRKTSVGECEDEIRSTVASSNYKTDCITQNGRGRVSKLIDAEWLLKEANEHYAEVFYGTFFADSTDSSGGICATVFQAYQNFPKAVAADESGFSIMLVPKENDGIILQSGMSREQRFLLDFHGPDAQISELNDRSIVYQMPYRPYVSPDIHKESGVWPDIFPQKIDPEVELNLISRADGHCRAYGMLNFGDSVDGNYTAQGRGKGRLVWSNNEYDYPHACALLYVRTGMRRFLDYNIASCSHWMDVDVCHYSNDPLLINGQWEHTAGHCINGVMVCSHEWVEGLLDYYHFTADIRGLETAVGIGENVKRLLDTPEYKETGQQSARETGWALRTLTALYVETSDPKWLKECDRILGDFKQWEEKYGHWMYPYMDNTLIRVGFMISVAIGSLMRYYKCFPSKELKDMIVRAVDDLIENCYVSEWGLFYYKELPGLQRPGNNTLLLEALVAAYDLTGDSRYLEYGMGTFKKAINDSPSYVSSKQKAEDTVLVGSISSKSFAQSMIPISVFYTAIQKAGGEKLS